MLYRSIQKVFLRPLTLAAVAMTTCILSAQAAVPDFTFVHISDEHSGAGPATALTIAELGTLSSVLLEPYKVSALPPAFVIETGDMTEFGPKNGAWEMLDKWYSTTNLTRYRALGNHDGAWRSLTPEMTKLYGAPYYSFDKFGCHFVILDSAGLQDPRPVLNPEELDWLKGDLKMVSPDTPVFVAMHHPLDVTEFSSAYEVDRLVDILRPYNVALVLVGHGHNAMYSNYDGLDMVEGGSAYGPLPPGYQVVSVIDGKLRVAFKERGEPAAEHAMLEKALDPPATRYPLISIQAPAEHSSYSGNVPIIAWAKMSQASIQSAYAEIDGSVKIALTGKSGGSFNGEISAADLKPGAHYVKVCFTGQDGRIYRHSTSFYADPPGVKVRWRAYLGAASKSTPTVAGKLLIVGSNNGRLHAYDIETGKAKWEFTAGGALTGQPLVLGGKVFAGSEDGFLYSVSASNGKLVWKYQANDPIYSTAVSDGSSIYFGSASGAFYSVSALTGKLNWKNTSATYNIENKPFIADGKIYYGCWDTFVYCLNLSDGSLVWKCMGQGSAEGTAPAYYSPADCGPVVYKGKIFAADRKYKCSIIDVSTGKMDNYMDGVSAVGLSADGAYLYLRKLGGNLVKIDRDQKEVWAANVAMDDIPAAPVESGGVVYVCSKRGLVSAVSSDNGRVLWQYQVTPSSFVISGMGVFGGHQYVVGTDGMLTVFGL